MSGAAQVQLPHWLCETCWQCKSNRLWTRYKVWFMIQVLKLLPVPAISLMKIATKNAHASAPAALLGPRPQETVLNLWASASLTLLVSPARQEVKSKASTARAFQSHRLVFSLWSIQFLRSGGQVGLSHQEGLCLVVDKFFPFRRFGGFFLLQVLSIGLWQHLANLCLFQTKQSWLSLRHSLDKSLHGVKRIPFCTQRKTHFLWLKQVGLYQRSCHVSWSMMPFSSSFDQGPPQGQKIHLEQHRHHAPFSWIFFSDSVLPVLPSQPCLALSSSVCSLLLLPCRS